MALRIDRAACAYLELVPQLVRIEQQLADEWCVEVGHHGQSEGCREEEPRDGRDAIIPVLDVRHGCGAALAGGRVGGSAVPGLQGGSWVESCTLLGSLLCIAGGAMPDVGKSGL